MNKLLAFSIILIVLLLVILPLRFFNSKEKLCLRKCEKNAKKIYMLSFKDVLIIIGQTLLISFGCIPFVLVLGIIFCISDTTCSLADKSVWTSLLFAGTFISVCSFGFVFPFFIAPRILGMLAIGTFIFETKNVRYKALSISYNEFNEICISDVDFIGHRDIYIRFMNNGDEVGYANVGGRLSTVSQRLKKLVKEFRLHGKKISIERRKKVKGRMWKIMNGEY